MAAPAMPAKPKMTSAPVSAAPIATRRIATRAAIPVTMPAATPAMAPCAILNTTTDFSRTLRRAPLEDRRERARVDVAARHDRDDLPGPGASRERRRDRGA